MAGWLEEGGGAGAATWWLGEGADPPPTAPWPREPREAHVGHCAALEAPLGFASLTNTS